MKQKIFFRIGIAVFATPLFAVGCQPVASIRPPGPVACTMDAKLCPDGTAVGRVGPSCEFAPCPPTPDPVPTPAPIPGPTPVPVPVPTGKGNECSGTNDTSCPSGTQCIQDCGPPVARESDPEPLWHCVDHATAAKPRMCPICLASNTMIATPFGDVNVKDIALGMRVWSQNAHGEKIASTVIRVSRTPVPTTHLVIHLVLSDGREVWVSPDHPMIHGNPVRALQIGDSYDGATVASADVVRYWDEYTYDLLTSSDTGSYWANGVLLWSTLSRP